MLLINSNDKFLKLYEDIHENRPLLQNGNLDPDEHYFTNHPSTCRYATLSDLNIKSVPGQFVFMHINCQSISNKVSDIQLLLTQLNVDVLAVTEIWLNDISASTLKIPKCTFVYRCRETGYGGLGFFIRHTVSFQPYDPFSSSASHATFESLFIRIS